MARRRAVPVVMAFPGSAPDERPVGALRFADPSTAGMTRQIHTFNDPPSTAIGEQNGVRSVTGALVPWPSREGVGIDVWAEMNRKRGVYEGEDE